MTSIRWTEEQYAEHVSKRVMPKPRPEYVPYKDRRKGLNKLESAYAEHLEGLKRLGQIEWWAFEPMRLRLADGTYYRPDFATCSDGRLTFHECKGFMREAARVRLNVAADRFPFPFYLVRKKGRGWDIKRVGGMAKRENEVLVPRGTIA
jgi:hypothetical protein